MKKAPSDNRVALDGEWDLSRKDELKALFARLSPRGGPGAIDMRLTTFFDSTALSLLAALRMRFGETPIRLLGPNADILRILRLMRFDDLFQIVDE